MKVVLAEKPPVGREIAKVLGANARRQGYMEGNGYQITWSFGHLVELKEPHEYRDEWKKWDVSVLPMVPEKFELRPRGDKGAQDQLKVIRALFKDADEIICATDAGREGELIFRYIQHYAKATRKPAKRLWVSSLTEQAIKTGFENLKNLSQYDHLYHAAKCRSEADWIVGINGTRFFTSSFSSSRNLWSVGRVQTPVLALIVERDLLIENFVPKDYWELHTVYRDVRFKHTKGKFDELEGPNALMEKIKDHDLVIKDIKEKKERELPPLLFDLTNLQKEMNRRFGLTADETLKAAQTLYEKKHLTYPRTDSQYLSKDMVPTLVPLLEKLKELMPTQIEAIDLANVPLSKRIINDAKVTDHHAIIPTDVLAGNLSRNEKCVYASAVLRFVTAFYPPCIKGITTVDAEVMEEKFRARGTVILEPGWTAIQPKKKQKPKKPGEDNEAQEMPKFVPGEQGPHKPEILAKKTKPPKHFTDATLLQLMETAGKTVDEDALKDALKEKGLGTPATRAPIIETILRRTYIRRQKKLLISTDRGRHLIRLVEDQRLKSAELTGDWEAQLKQMEQGGIEPVPFMAEVAKYTADIVGQQHSKTYIGPCPACGADIIEGNRGFGCSKYAEGCKFVLWKENFGAQLNTNHAREILQGKTTLDPLPIKAEGQPPFGRILLKGTELHVVAAEEPRSSGGTVLGTCPLCEGPVRESPKSFSCDNWRNGCPLTIWKTIAKKKISATMAKTLLKSKVTDELKGFTSKAGRPFSAKLKLGEDGKVSFDFPERNASGG